MSLLVLLFLFFHTSEILRNREGEMSNRQPDDPYPEIIEPPGRRRTDSFGKLLVRFLSIYWRSFVIVLWPLILLPLVIVVESTEAIAMRCLYVVGLMAVFWMTEVLPLPITGLIPIVLYPLMGIMSTSDTCACYMNDTTMMFIGSMVIAIVIENSGLHMRIALLIIKTIGCSHRRLTLGLFFVTMFLSMWISNTAATAMMLPIVETVLLELEAQGLGNMFICEENGCGEESTEHGKRPTNVTMVYYLVAAYASSLGGVGTLVGSGTNLTLKGFFEKRFPNSPGISLTSWMVYSVPPMLLMSFLTWMWLQIMYMGMFRPRSKDALAIDIGTQGEKVAAAVIEKKYKELGSITWHESVVGFLFVTVVLLWFLRNPGFVRGWPTYITNLQVKDSTAAAFAVLLFFILPSKLDFLRSFDSDPANRPTKPSPSMITWKLIHQKMHWSLILVLGGGFAISAGSTTSKLSTIIGNSLTGLKSINPFTILFIVCVFAETATELTSNVAVANIILPVLAEMCVAMRIHPLYLMLPASLCCSFSFHLPVGTPPNAIATAAGHIKTRDFAIAGIGPSTITLLVTTLAFSTWGNFVFNLDEFPDWAT
nr:PREDICTED: protein I'm not dead yet-like isoform X3 [Megachile rotundata]